MTVNDYDEELYLSIQDLGLDEKSTPYRIALQVVHQGYDSLSREQRDVYDNRVAPLLDERAMRNEIERLMSRDD